MSDNKKQPIGADGKPLVEYQYAEALEAAKEYFKGDDLAAMVWISKYALKDSFGHIYEKSPEQMHWRIANEIARIENNYPNPMPAEQVYELLKEFRQKEVEARKELKQVRKQLRQKIDSLENTLIFVNMALMPLLVILAGIVVAVVRHRRGARR